MEKKDVERMYSKTTWRENVVERIYAEEIYGVFNVTTSDQE